MTANHHQVIVAGIDVGSLTTETVLYDGRRFLATSLLPTGASSRAAAERSMQAALASAGLHLDQVAFIVATGYGRISVPFRHKRVTEITCHARGASYLYPAVRTVIDIGGQDSKVIRIDGHGKVVDFVMNEKCAAGTGRFLEVMARALEVDLTDLGELSLRAGKVIPISSMCTVFAESEVVSLIAEGHAREDIIRGLHDSIGGRIASLVDRVGLEEEVAITGGVARNRGMVAAIEARLGVRLRVPPEAQLVGALGAALLAYQEASS